MTSMWISSTALERLAGSLLHFVWQGAAIAIVAAVALRLLRRRSPESRYAAASGALLAMLAAPLITFAFYAETGALTLRLLSAVNDATTEAATGDVAAWTGRIVAAWLIGVAMFLTRLIGAWLLSRRLVRSATAVVTPLVRKTFERARASLNVHKKVRLLSGERLETPIVIGWLRPAILLPASAMTGLTTDQLLAVLAHELAHIRRHDFLVNGVQRAIECVLFYHPAVWWISGRIRVERERCCDDAAVRVCGNRLVYAQALVALEKARSAAPVLALPTAGFRVTDRVRRILGARANRDWQSAAAALLFAAILVGAGMLQQPTLAGPAIPPIAPAALPALPPVLEAVTPSPAAPLSALLAIATARGVPLPPPAEPPQAATAPQAPGLPSITAEREAARKEFGQLNLDFSAETLVKQAAEGDTIAVRMMLAAGMNPNVTAIYDFGVGVSSKEGAFVRNTDLDISTALISAAANGQAETLQLLLAAKADPNRKTQKGHTALIFASWRGHLEAVKALLAGGATVDLVSGEGYTALRAAAVNGNTDTLQTLLDRGANVKNPANLTIVQDTACKDHVDAVRILLEHGVPIDDKPGQTPALYCAARSGNERMLTLLLDKGANINLKNQGDQNRTPLIIAAANGRLGAIRLLLDRNADLDATSNPSGNYTYTALLHALGPLQNYRTQGSLGSQRERDNTEIVNLLLARGANANLGWYNNDTALIFAARNGWADIVKTLVEKGANVNATTRTGNETALTVAAKYPDVRQILISAGAR